MERTTDPPEALSSVTESPPLATQTWVPSEDTASAPLETLMFWTTDPSEASTSVTVPLSGLAHQTWVPSDEMPSGSSSLAGMTRTTGGITPTERGDAAPVPWALVAVTVKV